MYIYNKQQNALCSNKKQIKKAKKNIETLIIKNCKQEVGSHSIKVFPIKFNFNCYITSKTMNYIRRKMTNCYSQMKKKFLNTKGFSSWLQKLMQKLRQLTTPIIIFKRTRYDINHKNKFLLCAWPWGWVDIKLQKIMKNITNTSTAMYDGSGTIVPQIVDISIPAEPSRRTLTPLNLEHPALFKLKQIGPRTIAAATNSSTPKEHHYYTGEFTYNRLLPYGGGRKDGQKSIWICKELKTEHDRKNLIEIISKNVSSLQYFTKDFEKNLGIGQRVESKQIEIEYGKKLIMTQKLNKVLESDNSTCLPSPIYLAITLYNEPIITQNSAFLGLNIGQAYLKLAILDPHYPIAIKEKLQNMDVLITKVGKELSEHKKWDTVDTPETIAFVKYLQIFKESDIFNKKYQIEGLLDASAKIISQQTGESIDIVKIKYFPNAEKYEFIPKGSTWNYYDLNNVNKTYTKFYDNKTFIREIFDD